MSALSIPDDSQPMNRSQVLELTAGVAHMLDRQVEFKGHFRSGRGSLFKVFKNLDAGRHATHELGDVHSMTMDSYAARHLTANFFRARKKASRCVSAIT